MTYQDVHFAYSRRRNAGRVAWAASLLAVGACSTARPNDELPPEGSDVAILRQYAGPDSGEMRRMQVVVRRPEHWARIPLTPATIDFDREMALVITLGRVMSDHQSVRITRVWRHERQLRVEIATAPPPAGAPLALATPYCVAILPRCDLEVAGFAPEPPRVAVAGR